MNELKKRDDNAKCPICGEHVVVGASANWCPTFHYNCEHVHLEGEELLVAEFFVAKDFTVRLGHADSFFAPEGVTIVRVKDADEDGHR